MSANVNVRGQISGEVRFPKASAACGLTEEVKQALLTLAQKVAYVDEHGQDYYNALYAALYPPAELLSISASFAQGSHVVYDTDSLDSLKPYLTVTALYNTGTTQTVTGYTLSGALTEGTSTVTVSYNGKTTTFNVTVTHKVTQVTGITAVFTQGSAVIYDNASLDDLKPYLVVTASYDDGTSAAVSGYTLSGTLAVGTSTITASYSGFSDTFTVTVTAHPAVLTSITAVFTQGQNVVYDTDSLDTLKQYLVVTAHYDGNTDTVVSDYTLSGTLTEGTSTITVSYGGKTAAFTVSVSGRSALFGTFTKNYALGKKLTQSAAPAGYPQYAVWNVAVAARAAMTAPIKNKGYVFTVTDTSKYSIAVYDITDNTARPMDYDEAVTGIYYQGGTKNTAWSEADYADTPYIMIALKKNDGSDFTDEELANGAEAVFTYTENNMSSAVFHGGFSVAAISGRAYRTETAARATTTAPVFNLGYVFTSTDPEKYQVNAIDITSLNTITQTQSYDGIAYPRGSKTIAWGTTDSVTTPYVWLALKKMDGTDFTAAELADGAAAVFTYTTSE